MKAKILVVALMLLTFGAIAQPKPNSLQSSPQSSQNSSSISASQRKEITQQIEKMYRGATIKDIDKERDGFEVEIRHDKREKTVNFSNSIKWISTEYEIRSSELPKSVADAIRRSKDYSLYQIDDVDVVETAKHTVYEIEFDRVFRGDRKLRITSEGKIL